MIHELKKVLQAHNVQLKDIYAIDGIKLTRNKLYSPLKYDDIRLIARYLGMTTLDLLTKIDKDLAKR